MLSLSRSFSAVVTAMWTVESTSNCIGYEMRGLYMSVDACKRIVGARVHVHGGFIPPKGRTGVRTACWIAPPGRRREREMSSREEKRPGGWVSRAP